MLRLLSVAFALFLSLGNLTAQYKHTFVWTKFAKAGQVVGAVNIGPRFLWHCRARTKYSNITLGIWAFVPNAPLEGCLMLVKATQEPVVWEYSFPGDTGREYEKVETDIWGLYNGWTPKRADWVTLPPGMEAKET